MVTPWGIEQVWNSLVNWQVRFLEVKVNRVARSEIMEISFTEEKSFNLKSGALSPTLTFIPPPAKAVEQKTSSRKN